MYLVNRIKGKPFKTCDLVYAIGRYTEDHNISMVVDCESREVIKQRLKTGEKLNSQQGTWTHLQYA